MIDDILSGDREKDAKSRLQEWSQRNLGYTPIYETISMEGPDHAKLELITTLLLNELHALEHLEVIDQPRC